MEYRASLFAQGYFGHFIVAVSVILLTLLVGSGAYSPAVVLSILVLAGLWRIRACKMVFSATSFHYVGWLTSFTVLLSQVDRVVRGTHFGHATARLHGNEYCILTSDGKRHWVSLLFFRPPACRAFHGELVNARKSIGDPAREHA